MVVPGQRHRRRSVGKLKRGANHRIDVAVCHQVGRAHHKLLFDSLGIDPALAYGTLEFLGNTGSVALPISAAMGMENGHLGKDDRVAMLGIGSGINCLMLAVKSLDSAIVAGSGFDRDGIGLR